MSLGGPIDAVVVACVHTWLYALYNATSTIYDMKSASLKYNSCIHTVYTHRKCNVPAIGPSHLLRKRKTINCKSDR